MSTPQTTVVQTTAAATTTSPLVGGLVGGLLLAAVLVVGAVLLLVVYRHLVIPWLRGHLKPQGTLLRHKKHSAGPIASPPQQQQHQQQQQQQQQPPHRVAADNATHEASSRYSSYSGDADGGVGFFATLGDTERAILENARGAMLNVAVANQPYEPDGDGGLAFRAGEVVRVVRADPCGFWVGELRGEQGVFPVSRTTLKQMPLAEYNRAALLSYREPMFPEAGEQQEHHEVVVVSLEDSRSHLPVVLPVQPELLDPIRATPEEHREAELAAQMVAPPPAYQSEMDLSGEDEIFVDGFQSPGDGYENESPPPKYSTSRDTDDDFPLGQSFNTPHDGFPPNAPTRGVFYGAPSDDSMDMEGFKSPADPLRTDAMVAPALDSGNSVSEDLPEVISSTEEDQTYII